MLYGVSHASHGFDGLARRFHDRFAAQRKAFLAHIQGRATRAARDSYGSLILHRLIFLVFLQAAGLLAHDPHYLARHLHQAQAQWGPQTFFRRFLLRLFHEGMGASPLSRDQHDLFGRLPSVGVALFPPHPLEAEQYALHIPDHAFAACFTFFDQYQWTLEDVAVSSEQSIHPAMLGAIFESYVNEQHIGAYYTQDDVTEYIAKNTIVPCLLDHILSALAGSDAMSGIPWQFLQQSPDRYIPGAIRDQAYGWGETRREYDERRTYYAMLWGRMKAGALVTSDDLITYNLDAQQFLLDVLYTTDQPCLLEVCYQQLCRLTVLDPTCGSGAFLFAAFHVLQPFYQACLERMRTLHYDYKWLPTGWQTRTLDVVTARLIIKNNLYGIDIMEEAIEACRLRLILKMLAAHGALEDGEPMGELIEHIRVGNALCRWNPPVEDKQRVPEQSARQEDFSWQRAFPDQLEGEAEGFSVIIGNPPYVELRARALPYPVDDFTTASCGNLYPCVIERCRQLLAPRGRHGMVVPLAAFATRTMGPFLAGFRRWFPCSWVSFYHFRPAMLFAGGKTASIPTAIYLAKTEGSQRRYSTHLQKWLQEERPLLFERVRYCQITVINHPEPWRYYPKFGCALENAIMEKIIIQQPLREYLAPRSGANRLFYRPAGGLYWKVFVNFPWPYPSTSNKACTFQDGYHRDVFVAVLNSSLFWWYYTVTFDTYNLKDYLLFDFRFTYPSDPVMQEALMTQCARLMDDFRRHARHLKRGKASSYTIYARKSRPIIDGIDRLLATHYGLTAEELDFILRYDEKYRMGNKNRDS